MPSNCRSSGHRYCVYALRPLGVSRNDWLTLSGIPQETFEYRLGNRSALEWIIDQYQIKTDSRSGIVNDPNRYDDPQYIIRLIGQVIKISLETVRIIKELPKLIF